MILVKTSLFCHSPDSENPGYETAAGSEKITESTATDVQQMKSPQIKQIFRGAICLI